MKCCHSHFIDGVYFNHPSQLLSLHIWQYCCTQYVVVLLHTYGSSCFYIATVSFFFMEMNIAPWCLNEMFDKNVSTAGLTKWLPCFQLQFFWLLCVKFPLYIYIYSIKERKVNYLWLWHRAPLHTLKCELCF